MITHISLVTLCGQLLTTLGSLASVASITMARHRVNLGNALSSLGMAHIVVTLTSLDGESRSHTTAKCSIVLIAISSTTRTEEFKATISIPYEQGTLKAVGIDNQGNVVETRILKTAGEAVAIRLTCDNSSMNAGGEDVCFVTAELVDKDGIRVQDSEQKLRFEVKGNGVLEATGSADLKDTVSYKSNTRTTYKGMAMAVVRSSEKAGKATLIVSGKGIRQQINIRINSKKN